MIKFGPVSLYKLSAFMQSHHLGILSKGVDMVNRLLFGCWVPGSCHIGENLVLGYWGMAIVIHSSCVLGDRVHIDQCVTIGGNGTSHGVPTIGSDVYIGAGAKILGPINIGSNCIIGANAVVVRDVPDGSLVAGVPAKIIKSGILLSDHLYHLRDKLTPP